MLCGTHVCVTRVCVAHDMPHVAVQLLSPPPPFVHTCVWPLLTPCVWPNRYSTPVDVWSIGCIFAEMVNGRPLVSGTSEGDQLDRIFRLFGTPTVEIYPGLIELPEYNADLPRYAPPPSIGGMVPALSASGVDLFERMMAYDPAKRITAAEALQHAFFDDMKG